jgi:hypothetical protein
MRAHGLRHQGKVAFRSGDTVEFSPTEELGRTLEVVTRNMKAMDSATS